MVVQGSHLEPLEGLPAGHLATDRLAAELDAVRERVQVLEARMEQLNQVLVTARREEVLLEDLLALRRGDVASASSAPRPTNEPSKPTARVADAVVAILERNRRSMHISEIMLALQQEKVPIPGSGQQANLISYIRRDSRIARPSRGVYGLREWGLEDATPHKKKGTRKRTRSGGRGGKK